MEPKKHQNRLKKFGVGSTIPGLSVTHATFAV